MALWTPYAEESALDLSKTGVNSQQFSYIQLPIVPNVHYGFSPIIGQVSPLSNSSGYDSVVYSPLATKSAGISPPATIPAVLSPPAKIPAMISTSASPQIVKRSLSEVEADYLSDDPDFQEFERKALKMMAEKNGGSLVGNNPRMRRSVRSTNSDQDDVYRRQRERNNYAAKQSRDRRKLREIHLSLKVSYLKKEVAALKAALSTRVCVRCHQNCLCY